MSSSQKPPSLPSGQESPPATARGRNPSITLASQRQHTAEESDTAIARAEQLERRLEDLDQQLNNIKNDTSFKAQLSRAKAAAVETSDLQTRLNQAVARAEQAEKIADTLRQEKESAQDMIETMVEEHGALLEKRNQLGKENTELKTRISGLLNKKSTGLLSVPDSDATDDEVDMTEAATSSSQKSGKRRKSEAIKAHRADPSRTAKITASASRRQRRSSTTPPPQGPQSDFESDLPSRRDKARRFNLMAQPNPKSAWRSAREQTEDEDSEIEILVPSSRKNGKRRRLEAARADSSDHSRNPKATASASRRRRRPSSTPESQSDSEPELPFDIDEVQMPGYTAQPIPRSVWRVVRGQMAIWDQKRPEWRVQEEKLVCASSYTRKRSSEFSDGPDHACSHCKKHGNVCVVVCGGRIRLLPVKGAEAMGEESEGYWKAAAPERKAAAPERKA